MEIYLKQLAIGPMMNYVYLIGDNLSDEVVVIDAGWDAEAIINEAKKDYKKISAILITHSHFDHSNVVDKLFSKTRAPVFIHDSETQELSNDIEKFPTNEGMIIEKAGLKIKCIHTPGHTPGSQCFMVEKIIFTGDTLFVDCCGRVDLPGSSPTDMDKSLKRLALLPDDTIVYPGHNYGPIAHSTIGVQKKSNYYMVHGVD